MQDNNLDNNLNLHHSKGKVIHVVKLTSKIIVRAHRYYVHVTRYDVHVLQIQLYYTYCTYSVFTIQFLPRSHSFPYQTNGYSFLYMSSDKLLSINDPMNWLIFALL